MSPNMHGKFVLIFMAVGRRSIMGHPVSLGFVRRFGA